MMLIKQVGFVGLALWGLAFLPACARTTTTAKSDAPAVHAAVGPAASTPSIPAPTVTSRSADSSAGLHRFQDAFFDYETSVIREDAKRSLQEDARLLTQHPEMTITIGGYCDERGTDEYNLALGNRRAEAVKRYLIALGVKPAQLKTISYGKEKPFCTDHNEACYQQNRRGQLIVAGSQH